MKIDLSVNEVINANPKEFKKKYGITKTSYLLDIPPEYVNRLSKEELFKLTKSLSSTATNRKSKLEDFLIENPNVPRANIVRVGHKINYIEETLTPNKDMSIQKLRNLYIKQRNFLNAKSSTEKGIKSILKDFYKRIGKGLSEVYKITLKGDYELSELSNDDYKKLWNIYKAVEERYVGSGFDSNQIQAMAYDIVQQYGEYNDVEDLISIMEEMYTPEYLYETKKMTELDNEDDDTFSSSFGK